MNKTVIEHLLSGLQDIGIAHAFGVAGDFAFPIDDARPSLIPGRLEPLSFGTCFLEICWLISRRFYSCARLMQARSSISLVWALSDTSAYPGFSGQSHFGRHFRRVYDMTPGEYQQSVVAV